MAWRGQAALARPTPLRASGAALGGPHGAVYFPSGTKGQQPLVFPALAGLREGRGALQGSVSHLCASAGVPRGAPHARIVTLWDETPGRWLGRRERADRAVPVRVAQGLQA